MDVLFLDDSETRQKAFKMRVPYAKIVSTVPETIEQLSTESWDFVFLDHDLNGEVYVDSDRDDCGMEVVRWMLANDAQVHKVVCHSLHDEAREVMMDQLVLGGYDAMAIPFLYFHEGGVYDALEQLRQVGET